MEDWKDKLARLKAGKHPAPGVDGKVPPPARTRGGQRGAAPAAKPPALHFCLGLDFGTSATKAVIQALPSGPAFAVPLGRLAGCAEVYLAPTRLWLAPDGEVSRDAVGAGEWVEDLKVRLMSAPWTPAESKVASGLACRPVDFAAAYLASAIRQARAWCDEEVRPRFGGCDVTWSMNLGIPARDFDATDIRSSFRAVARAAWHLGATSAPFDVEQVAACVDAARADSFAPAGLDASMIEVVPEVAAGVASYSRSQLRRPGPHLFVDVGATTIDVSLFLFGAGEELKYVFLAADVSSDLGALQLHRYRAAELARLALAQCSVSDPSRPIPATVRDCIPPDAELEQIDADFAERCACKIGATVYQAKLKAPDDLSVADGDPTARIQVLCSGGGIEHSLYRESLNEAGRRAAPGGGQGLRVRSFEHVPIPRPAQLDPPDLPDESWKRLAVAFGLSYRFEDIGEFVPPSAVPMLPRAPRKDAAVLAPTSKDHV
jgi:hypothetical protein